MIKQEATIGLAKTGLGKDRKNSGVVGEGRPGGTNRKAKRGSR